MKPIIYILLSMTVPLLTFLPHIASASESSVARGVEISRFSASRIQNLISLNWNTVGERNTLGFEIERRSQFDADWRTIAFVRAQGTAIVGQVYSFVESMDMQAVLFYRLKQIDASGSAMYTQSVTVMPDEYSASMRVNPAPRNRKVEYNQISFVLPNEGMVRFSVHDVYGRPLLGLSKDRVLDAGFHVVPFGSVALPAGVYSVRLETTEGTFTGTLIKTS
jgi:hypothetical protein